MIHQTVKGANFSAGICGPWPRCSHIQIFLVCGPLIHSAALTPVCRHLNWAAGSISPLRIYSAALSNSDILNDAQKSRATAKSTSASWICHLALGRYPAVRRPPISSAELYQKYDNSHPHLWGIAASFIGLPVLHFQ